MSNFHSLSERTRESLKPKLYLPLKESISYSDLALRCETTPLLFDSVFKMNEKFFSFCEVPDLSSSFTNPQNYEPIIVKSILPIEESFTPKCEKLPKSFGYKDLPVTNFRSLNELLRDYLFGKVEAEKDYDLSEREVVLLKYLLKKKFYYSNCSEFSKRVAKIKKDNASQFLIDNPQKKRTQLLKRMLFTKFWKFLKLKGIDALRTYFDNVKRFDYLSEMNMSNGNIANKYYDRCFENKLFRNEFIKCLDNPTFWDYCLSKSIRSFNKRFSGWIFELDKLHQGEDLRIKEKQILLKIKFMSFDTDKNRVLRLFKIL